MGAAGAAGLARAGAFPPADAAVGGQLRRAGRPVAWGHCGSCFTCGSRVAAIPPRAAKRSHASVSTLWRATGGGHGCRVLHQCTPTPRRRPHRRSRGCACLRQISSSRGHPPGQAVLGVAGLMLPSPCNTPTNRTLRQVLGLCPKDFSWRTPCATCPRICADGSRGKSSPWCCGIAVLPPPPSPAFLPSSPPCVIPGTMAPPHRPPPRLPPLLPQTLCFPIDRQQGRCTCELTANGGLRAYRCVHTFGGL